MSIDGLGPRCLKAGGARQHSALKEVSMATLQVATTRQCHTEILSGIFTNHNLTKSNNLPRVGLVGKKWASDHLLITASKLESQGAL